MSNKITVPIFYACDDAFIKYTIVSLKSMMENASADYLYDVHVLSTTATEEMKEKVLRLQNNSFSITFDDVSGYLEKISESLPIRDYYSKTTYYRLFIAEMFPDLDKVIYIDSDTIVQGDVSELYMTDIGECLVGACHEQAMVQIDTYGTYVEKNLDIDRNNYFNAGLLLINARLFRETRVLERFTSLLGVYNFVVTQDEDYLNVICKDKVFFLDQRWNTEMIGEIPYPAEEFKMIHYIMVSKPWHYADCMHGDIFWKYAEMTEVCEDIRAVLDGHTDEMKARDKESADRLLATAVAETERNDTFTYRMKKLACSPDRRAIMEKIEQFEREGRFDEDVEDDPPSRQLEVGEVDYTQKKLKTRILSKFAFARAHKFGMKMIRDGQLVVKELRGIENFKDLDSGAIITCNHFNAFDSFAIQLAYYGSEQAQNKRKFFRVIREGNYTSFPGFFGFLMRHCNTLPLSSNRRVMREFMSAVDSLLSDGHFILVYPEQSMWWNYRKPKPLKDGAFYFAAKNNAPVLPCFITMQDTDKLDENGYPIQEYTIHICEPIYPDKDKKIKENTAEMMAKNYEAWQKIYEETYGIPLKYTTGK